MNDFREALQKGIDGHNRAKAARAEMDEVLAEASRQIGELLGHNIRFTIGCETVPSREPSHVHSVARIPAPQTKRPALLAEGGHGQRTLAEVELGDLGYPLVLRWGDRFEHVSDRAGLERALSALLQTPDVGAALLSLAQAPPF